MSSLYKLVFFIFKLFVIKNILCLPLENETHSFNDQRQTGKFNIHISLRDVAIIEVDKNEFSEDAINADDYYYDEEDLTISPISNWVSTTIKTPQLIVNTLKSQTFDLENIQNNKQVFKHSPSQHKELPNLAVPDSTFVSNSTSSLLPPPSSGKTKLESEMGAGNVAQELVSHVLSEPRLMSVPIQRYASEHNKDNSLSGSLQKGRTVNTSIPSILTAETVLPKVPVICKNYKFRDANGNCRSLKRHTFLKSLFDMLKLMRMKN